MNNEMNPNVNNTENVEINAENVESVTEDTVITVPNSEARRYFSRICFALFALAAINFGIQIAVATLVAYLAPSVYNAFWFDWVLSVVPLYGVALPIFFTLLPKSKFELPAPKRLTFPKILLALLIAVATMTLFNYVSFYTTEFFRFISQDKLFSTDALNDIISDTPIYVTFFVVCVIAPIGEEFIFRKLLIDKTLPFGELASCLLSGIVFGLFHGNLRQAIYATALGLVLAYVYVKTRNIVYPIIMHAVVNLLGSIVSPGIANYANDYIQALENGNITLEGVFAMLLMLGFFAVGGAILVGGIVAFIVMACRKKIRFEKGKIKPEGKLSSVVCKNPGAIVMVVAFAILIIRAATI